MSCTRTIKYFEKIEVKIDTCNKQEIENLEKAIVFSINQKLEKLNILIKNCDIYLNGNCLLVNDRFNICPGLKEVAEAFGLQCEQVECSLRGKSYLITDKLLKVLKQIDGTGFVFGGNIANQSLKDIVKDINPDYTNLDIDEQVLAMVRNIRKNGSFTTTMQREVTRTLYDGRLVNETYGEWDASNITEIQNKLLKISKEASETVEQTKTNLREGTAKLIYTRARQMGYAVQEVKKGKQTQLVLVRYE